MTVRIVGQKYDVAATVQMMGTIDWDVQTKV
jgi:hypothetical protein